MTRQTALTLTAASIGFVSAFFFCMGAITNTPEAICLQSTPRWDFSEPIAQALSAERAQYLVGAALLVAAFFLQIWAALASPTLPSSLPQWLQDWRRLVLVVFLVTVPAAYVISLVLESGTTAKVMELRGPQDKAPEPAVCQKAKGK